MLLSETMLPADKVWTITHIGTRVAFDTCIKGVERGMGKYGRAAPSGVTAAIDLLMFSQVMTRKTTLGSTLNTNFGIDTWGSKAAVVPVKMEYSGTRGVVPYALSFVSTSYWNQRVGYHLTLEQVGADPAATLQAYCVPRAAQAHISGPMNILFVVIDIEVSPNDRVYFEVAGTQNQIVGKGMPSQRVVAPTVRSIVDYWMGTAGSVGMPVGRQRDAYDALTMLDSGGHIRGVRYGPDIGNQVDQRFSLRGDSEH